MAMFPSCDAMLLCAMAKHLWDNPNGLNDLLPPSSSSYFDLHWYEKSDNVVLPPSLRPTGKLYKRNIFESLAKQLDDTRAAVVTGSEGVGKTVFLWHDVIHRLTRAEPCVWVLHDGVVLATSGEPEVLPLSAPLGADSKASDPLTFKDATLYLDWTAAMEAAGVPPAFFALADLCKTVLIASAPLEEHWAFLRRRADWQTNVLVLPPWTVHEIHDGASVILAFNAPQIVHRLIDRLGTVPRDIFAVLQRGPGTEDALWGRATRAIRADDARELQRLHDTPAAASGSGAPPALFVLCPADMEGLAWDGARCVYRSAEIMRVINERAEQAYEAERGIRREMVATNYRGPPGPLALF